MEAQDDYFVKNLHHYVRLYPFWEMEFIKVYDYVSNRLNLTIDEKVTVLFVPPQEGNCAPRGVTIHEQQPVIIIFVDQDTSNEQILATLAHELGYVFR